MYAHIPYETVKAEQCERLERAAFTCATKRADTLASASARVRSPKTRRPVWLPILRWAA